MARNQHDHFYRMAKKDGYRSRAAYKLKQIDSRFHVIRRRGNVTDLGAAPSGWLRMAKELSGGGGDVLCVDIQPIRKIEGVITIVGDITAEDTVCRIRELIGSADIVKKVRSLFRNVRAHSHEASRKASAETYLIAKRFRSGDRLHNRKVQVLSLYPMPLP